MSSSIKDEPKDEKETISESGPIASSHESKVKEEDDKKTIGVKRKRSPEPVDELDLAPSRYTKRLRQDDSLGTRCPYLDQIDRKTLDFDFEKVCSVSMSNHNVYGCLVCGYFFAGRAKGSPAYVHALQEHHRVFIHLDNAKIYCLPDPSYEVIDPSLNDIKHNLHPTFTPHEIAVMDTRVEYSHALDGRDYLPGVIGLNNLNNTDWLNVIIQMLVRVKMLRNFFISESNYSAIKSPFVHLFGEMVRKYFNNRNFKGQVSPHELLQYIREISNKRFAIGKPSDPLTFLSWFLNTLHRHLNGSAILETAERLDAGPSPLSASVFDTIPAKKSKNRSSIVSKSFQGIVVVTTRIPIRDENEMDVDDAPPRFRIERKKVPFFYLLLELPPMPLFREKGGEKFIPQVPLQELLAKFEGEKEEILPDGSIRTYHLAKVPPYLLVVFKRFTENKFYVEKNNTIVNFVLKNVDFSRYLKPLEIDPVELHEQPVAKLKEKLRKLGGDPTGLVDKGDLIQSIIDHFPRKSKWKTKYDLVANCCHEGEYLHGTNRAYIYHEPNNQWYEMQDLQVQERMPQLVAVSESYIQLWRRRG